MKHPQAKLEASLRIAQILAASLDMASRTSYQAVTRNALSAQLGISPTLIPFHMGSMSEFRQAIMREAVRVGCLPVLAQGIVARHPVALAAPAALKARALRSLAA